LCSTIRTDEDSTDSSVLDWTNGICAASSESNSTSHTLVWVDHIDIHYNMLDVIKRGNVQKVVISEEVLQMLAKAKDMVKNIVLDGL